MLKKLLFSGIIIIIILSALYSKVRIPQDLKLYNFTTGKTFTFSECKGKTVIMFLCYDDGATWGLKFREYWEPLVLDRIRKMFPENVTVVLGYKHIHDYVITQMISKYSLEYPVIDPSPLETFIEESNNKNHSVYDNYYIINDKGIITDIFSNFDFHRNDIPKEFINGELIDAGPDEYITREKILRIITPHLTGKIKPTDFPLSLTEAAYLNDLEAVSKLVKNGANCNQREFQYTPLHWVVKNKSIRMVQILLEYGADPDYDCDGLTPLFHCISDDLIDIVKLLIENGANPFLRCNSFNPKIVKMESNTPYQEAKKIKQNKLSVYYEKVMGNLTFLAGPPLTHKEILAKGIKPKLPPDFDFPVSRQGPFDCWGYSVKNLVKYKYGIDINVLETQEKFLFKDKPKPWEWYYSEMDGFLILHRLSFRDISTSFNDLFVPLIKGEPVLVNYDLITKSGYVIPHWVTAYSFDEKGLWVSDPAVGKRVHLAYDKIFFIRDNKFNMFAGTIKLNK